MGSLFFPSLSHFITTLFLILSLAVNGEKKFPFSTSQELSVGFTQVRASRITYVGELGWELYVPIESTSFVYDLLQEKAQKLGTLLQRFSLFFIYYYYIQLLKLREEIFWAVLFFKALHSNNIFNVLSSDVFFFKKLTLKKINRPAVG